MLFQRTLLVFLVAAMSGACAIGGDPSPEGDPAVEPAAEPDAGPDLSGRPLGLVNIKVYDDATDDLLCDKSAESRSDARDENFAFNYIYLGEPAGETVSFQGGHVSTLNEVADFASIILSASKAADGVFDVPPTDNHQWALADFTDWGGILSCGTSTDEGGFDENSFGVALDFDTDSTSLVSLSAELDSYVGTTGWEASPICPGDMVSTTCEAQEGKGRVMLNLVGKGNSFGNANLLRVEVSIEITDADALFSRDAS